MAGELATEYEEEYEGFDEDEYFRSIIRRELRTRFRVYVGDQARILDVGCGNGLFVAECIAEGYTAHGVDTSSAAIELAHRRGIPAQHGDFLTSEFPWHWDAITMWDVLEHLSNPREFVRKAWDALRPGGLLVIKTPEINPRTLDLVKGIGVFGRFLLQPPAHLQYFNEGSLRYLLREERFQIRDWLKPRRMRGRKPIASPRRLAGHVVRQLGLLLSRNRNLYVFAEKSNDNKEAAVQDGRE